MVAPKTAPPPITLQSDSPLSSLDSDCSSNQDLPPFQLSQIVEAATCLQENIAAFRSRDNAPTTKEVADLVIMPCQRIICELQAAIDTYSACIKHVEERTRTQVGAEIMAVLLVPKRQ